MAGDTQKANEILYESRERKRREVANGSRWWEMTLLKSTMGYGYGTGYFRSLIWVLVFVVIGMGYLWRTGEGRKNRIGFWYSLDLLLPVIQLDKYHYDQVRWKAR
jgi:hypothetical protein